MTCAVEWRRIARPSGSLIRTGSTTSPGSTGLARSRSWPLTRAAITACSPGCWSPRAASARAAPAVVPAWTTSSRRARVISGCWVDTAALLGTATDEREGPVIRCYRCAPGGVSALQAGHIEKVGEYLVVVVMFQAEVPLAGQQGDPGAGQVPAQPLAVAERHHPVLVALPHRDRGGRVVRAGHAADHGGVRAELEAPVADERHVALAPARHAPGPPPAPRRAPAMRWAHSPFSPALSATSTRPRGPVRMSPPVTEPRA